jgi:6-phosphogluconolactonase
MRKLEVLDDRAAVERIVATALLDAIADATFARGRADIVITGGTVGIGTLAQVARIAEHRDIAWHLVHLWWGDERFVPTGDPDRNEGQAATALIDHIAIPERNVHAFPADDGQGIGAARDAFRSEVRTELGEHPRFDVVLNGIGPDGHVASLFPGLPHGELGDLVIALENSPKPPPARLSFTFEALNGGRRVWIVAAGDDKADAIARLMSGSPVDVTPASGLHGTDETVVFIDRAAASAL